jgi:hypothetical protein
MTRKPVETRAECDCGWSCSPGDTGTLWTHDAAGCPVGPHLRFFNESWPDEFTIEPDVVTRWAYRTYTAEPTQPGDSPAITFRPETERP